MKKIFVGLMLSVLVISFASAYNTVGEEITLPHLETQLTSDMDYSDGYARYIYCTYELDSPGEESCQGSEDLYNGDCDTGGMFPLAWGTNPIDGSNPFNETHICGLVDEGNNGWKLALVSGTTTFNVVISQIDVSFDESTGTWIPGQATIIDHISEEYKTIPVPDQSFIQSLINTLLGVICQIHHFGYCTL